ncbi:hypothetical protein [Streptomyces sp. NBC_00203]|uniref:hypothetical protein n=1 Tax=Streptomyces sp. NBC_00203 TaxID=2975680 RepID=UPI0032560B7D
MHIDERENSVTLGFDTRSFPSNPPEEWVEKGLATHGGAFFEVVLGSEDSGIAFRAAKARLAKARGYLASDSP